VLFSLVLDVLLNDRERRPAAGDGAVTRAPEVCAPELFTDLWEVLPAKAHGRRALQPADEHGEGDLWRVGHEEVDMVVLTVEFEQFRLEVAADLRHGASQEVSDAIRDDATPIFRRKD